MHGKIENIVHTTIENYAWHHICSHVKQCHIEQTPQQHAAVNLTLTDDVQFMPNLEVSSFHYLPYFVKVLGDRGRAVSRPTISANTRTPFPTISVNHQAVFWPTSWPDAATTNPTPSSSPGHVIPASLAWLVPDHFVVLPDGVWA